MKHKPFVIVLSAPSGTGKTTVLNRVRNLDPNLYYSVSITTRSPRPGEINGVDYIFTTKENFVKMINENELLEWAQVFGGEYYGTLKAPVLKALQEGKDVIMDLDIQGKTSLEKFFGEELVSIFLLPPSIKELKRRLQKRQTETEDELKERLERAKLELKWAEKYQYLVISSDVEKTAFDIITIIRAERMKRSRLVINLDLFIQ
ncbi:MAG: guanylate kinase [candidate division WOR-3 bacterium]